MQYTKTDKLITALYMVTDIIDKDEPLRNKLRTLGTGIISDTYLIQSNHIGHTASLMRGKISEIISFLGIASAINIISEMNCNILKKEFLELDQSIKEFAGESKTLNRQIDISEFLSEEFPPLLNEEGVGGGNPRITTSSRWTSAHSSSERRRGIPKGHMNIGVQKGSTLMKALSNVSDRNVTNNFDILKKQRREEITNFITKSGGNATITDIRSGATGALVSCSEKTLQRELVSMVKDGVLNKTGEKRWSKYALPARNA